MPLKETILEYLIVAFLAGFVQFMYVSGSIVPTAISLIALLIGSVYFVGWSALLAVLVGMVYVKVLYMRGDI